MSLRAITCEDSGLPSNASLIFNRRLIRGGNWRRRFRHKRRQLRSFLTSSCWGSRSTTAGWTESGRDRGAGWGEVERHGRDLTWDFLLCVKASFRKFWHVQLSNCKWKFLHSIHMNMYHFQKSQRDELVQKKVKEVGCTVSINLTKKHVSLTFYHA